MPHHVHNPLNPDLPQGQNPTVETRSPEIPEAPPVSYDGTVPGLGEAKLLAIQAALSASDKIAVLNTALSRTTAGQDLSYLVSTPYGGPMTSDRVVVGDIEGDWDITTGCLRISVASGDYRQGLEFDVQREFIDQTPNSGMQTQVYTSVFAYFHSKTFRSDQLITQARQKELARERVSDWLRWTLNWHVDNDHTNLILPLASRDYNDAPDFDTLCYCMAKQGYKGLFQRDFGQGQYCYGVHVLHTGKII